MTKKVWEVWPLMGKRTSSAMIQRYYSQVKQGRIVHNSGKLRKVPEMEVSMN